MTNFNVVYKMATKEDRDGYYKEAKELGVAEKSRAEAGCHRYDFSFPAESDTTLFLWEQWETREHQAAHCKTEHFAALGKLKEKYGVETEISIADEA